MTRSPILTTILTVIPLAAVAWPLSHVLQARVPIRLTPQSTATLAQKTTPADLEIRSAHPFSQVSVRIGENTWHWGPDDDYQEIEIPADPKLTLLVTATWPDHTPETAIALHLYAEGRADRTYTLWGEGEVTQEIVFSWE